ncbi:MAG: 2-hydroxy-3-oxopropionate reductase [Hyphomicrobiales bacterium]|jgi:3-hydroxyisobutyrate dehydrogenase-like beta-hydroxyacid dehydrogenase|nr:2-hydroxy-3-oxopropionate reductase [Hyphomicrobiales bacterium]
MNERIGFIGLGLMGTGFTKRLIATGHEVIGYDPGPARMDEAVRRGVRAAPSAADVANAADIILICVINTAAMEDATLGTRGVATSDIAGKIVVDHSTAEIKTTLRVAEQLQARGAQFVDAPVSGGPGAAESGTLAIMAGGAPEAIARIAPVMRDLGTMTHMGGVGAGQATKLVNQTVVLTNYCVLAEALRLGEAYGVDTRKIAQALAPGHAGSNLMPVLLPRMIEKDFAPRGYVRQVLKDLEMLQAAAADEHVAMPMAAQALTLYRLLAASGRTELDASAVVTLYPEQA